MSPRVSPPLLFLTCYFLPPPYLPTSCCIRLLVNHLLTKYHSTLSPSLPLVPLSPFSHIPFLLALWLFLHVWLGIWLLTVGSRQTTAPASVTAAAAAVAAAAGTTAGLVEQGITVAHPGHATPPTLPLVCTCLWLFELLLLLFSLYSIFSATPPSFPSMGVQSMMADNIANYTSPHLNSCSISYASS